MLREYAAPMTLLRGDQEIQIRAFLQDTHSKSIYATQREFSPLGEVPKGIYVYIGPVEPAASVGDGLRYQGRLLEMRRTELVMLGQTPIYCWGLCVEKGSDDQWGS